MEVPRVFVSRRSRRRTLPYTLALLAGWGLVLVGARTLAPQLGEHRALRATIRGFDVETATERTETFRAIAQVPS